MEKKNEVVGKKKLLLKRTELRVLTPAELEGVQTASTVTSGSVSMSRTLVTTSATQSTSD